jgi:hypothetical protein
MVHLIILAPTFQKYKIEKKISMTVASKTNTDVQDC